MKKMALFGALLLSACQHEPVPQLDPNFNPQAWALTGKISLTYPNCQREDCPLKTEQGRISWQHQNEQEALVFYDPFGVEHAALKFDGQRFYYRDAQGESVFQSHELKEKFGVDFPIQQLATSVTSPEALPETVGQWTRRNWQGTHYQSIALQQKDVMIKLFVQELQPLSE